MKKLFLVSCIVLGAINNLFTGPLDRLAAGLKNVSLLQPKVTQQSTGTNNRLLGPWLLQHHPRKLIAYDKNFQNTGAQVYQIKVLRQWKGDCWVHAFRNALFIMDLVFAPRSEFDEIYHNMVDHKQYKAFTKYGCPRPGSVTRKFIEKQLDCRPTCIPENSLVYLRDSLIFDYEPHLKDAALLADEYNRQWGNRNRLIELIHNLHNKKNYCCSITLTSGHIDHEMTLVIHKKNNVVEYLFSESNNISYKGDNFIEERGRTTVYYAMSQEDYLIMATTYSAAIARIIFWVNNPGYFNNLVKRQNKIKKPW